MIMEFRTYTMMPGTRKEFATFFENEVIPRMTAVGMNVVGQFSSVTHENEFAYARTFDSIEQRESQYQAYYESEDWLGWMIETAIGKEESFLVFLGDSDLDTQGHLPGMSGTHAAKFTLASSIGTVTAIDGETIAVAGDDGTDITFALPADVRVYALRTGRGMETAPRAEAADLASGDRVLVLGAESPEGPVARQIVKRPSL
jgi:hypothetical protein